jgi:hypothetical protein
MTEVVFLLEELSAQAMIEGLLPRVISTPVHVRFIPFEGKQDLDKNIEKRLRNYLVPDALFIILRDQDSSDCKKLKEDLVRKCVAAGKPNAIVRIVCRELESWYLGDLLAVEAALGLNNLAKLQNKQKYRNPDRLSNAAEELVKITSKKYQKIDGSRAIGQCLSLTGNRSDSFRVFLATLQLLNIPFEGAPVDPADSE